VKTLSDPGVQDTLSSQFILATHNQLPGLYCNNSIDHGTDRYPAGQVESCPESAGGGNLRVFVCRPSGGVVAELLGYWGPDTFLRELRLAAAMATRDSSRAELEGLHRECLARHVGSPSRPEKLLVRAHQESIADLFVQVRTVLDRIEDEVYTKGAVG
jgi:hypothetical protein